MSSTGIRRLMSSTPTQESRCAKCGAPPKRQRLSNVAECEHGHLFVSPAAAETERELRCICGHRNGFHSENSACWQPASESACPAAEDAPSLPEKPERGVWPNPPINRQAGRDWIEDVLIEGERHDLRVLADGRLEDVCDAACNGRVIVAAWSR